VAAAELDGYRRAYGLDHPGPAKHRWGRASWGGWAAAPATRVTVEQAGGSRGQPGRRSRAADADRRGDHRQRPTVAAGQRYQVDPEPLLGAEPRREAPGRRRDWQMAWAALERLAGWDRHRGHRDQLHPDRDRSGRGLGPQLARQERDGR
jgi:hypothetical protein